jgi:hypothetical protein
MRYRICRAPAQSIGYRCQLSLRDESFSEFSGDSMPKSCPFYVARPMTSGISYAGHSTTLADGQRYILEWKDWTGADSVGRKITGMTEVESYVHMSPYSGALTYLKGDIDYYL